MSNLGLTTSTGTYDITRYPWAYGAWQKQQRTHWLPEEVPMGNDIRDWTNLKDEERNLLTQIFRFFTQSDVEVGGNYLDRLIPFFKPLEVRMMMTAFANMETVHIDAYALILKTLGMPQSEFEAFKLYKEMSTKATYLQKFSMNTDVEVAKTIAVYGCLMEGMALFSSFAMLLNFPRFNKMNGMGQIVTWSVRDESLHCEAMIKLYHQWCIESRLYNRPSLGDEIRDIAWEMTHLEFGFVHLAFEQGGIEGLKEEEVKDYVSYITDWRLSQLGVKNIFRYFQDRKPTKPHPLPWLVSALNGVEHANFFEQRSTDYSKAATEGNWEDVWS